MVNKFIKKQDGDGSDSLVRKTLPMPVTCGSCGFELPEDAEKNTGFFVNFLICRDKNRSNKEIHGMPSLFLKHDNVHGLYRALGDSAGGYHLKDNYTFVKWVVFCVRCHSNKSRLDDMSRKTNNMIATGKTESLSIEGALKKLRTIQNMKNASKYS